MFWSFWSHVFVLKKIQRILIEFRRNLACWRYCSSFTRSHRPWDGIRASLELRDTSTCHDWSIGSRKRLRATTLSWLAQWKSQTLGTRGITPTLYHPHFPQTNQQDVSLLLLFVGLVEKYATDFWRHTRQTSCNVCLLWQNVSNT